MKKTEWNLGRLLASVFKYCTLIGAVIAMVLPLIVVVFGGFKEGQEFRRTGPLVLPENFFNFENYVTAFVKGKMVQGFGMTVIILVASLIGAIIIGTMISYALHRFDFKLKQFILLLFMLATLIPAITTQVATFQLIYKLGLYNNLLAPILLYMGTDIIAVYIFMQFLDNISYSLDEAAMIEGAGYFKIYTKIILPLLKPAIATVVIIKGVAIYNDFYIPFLYIPDHPVLSTALFRFKGPFAAKWEIICAGIVIIIIPTLIGFLGLQKHIYNGLTSGSVK
ncbi:MAG: putative transporter permease protein [Clostridia bacterium]|jgi:multiple sugar transport system permease protein|nr:putative transporter permease protein [Clostridia bacterium]